MQKNTILVIAGILVVASLMLGAIGAMVQFASGDNTLNVTTSSTPTPFLISSASTTSALSVATSLPVARNEQVASVPNTSTTSNNYADTISGLNLSEQDILNIADEYNSRVDAIYMRDDILDLPEGEVQRLNDEIAADIASRYGITADDVHNVVMYDLYEFAADYAATSEQAQAKTYTLEFGELLDTTINGNMLIIKAKIKPSYSNHSTISQNYFNVCDIIKNQGGDQYESIDYWAVADMVGGDESKVISFTVDKSLIDIIAEDRIAENMIGDYVSNLWILPSLQE